VNRPLVPSSLGPFWEEQTYSLAPCSLDKPKTRRTGDESNYRKHRILL
jgi:hypothetical protein